MLNSVNAALHDGIPWVKFVHFHKGDLMTSQSYALYCKHNCADNAPIDSISSYFVNVITYTGRKKSLHRPYESERTLIS